jgi:hypothetical protein
MRLLIPTVLLLLAVPGSSTSDVSCADPKKFGEVVLSPVGLWVVPESQVREANEQARVKGENVIYGPPHPFYFDGETATMHLYCTKAWMWRTPDDCYRVRTKWVGDQLYWLPPFGRWEKKAAFRNGRFQHEQSGVVWKYERMPLNRVKEELRPLLKEREKHDYSITPLGDRDQRRLKNLD